ncbi:MAG TPA: type I-E CRISPR-associated protein Cse2/CasB [Fimbriimonadaceae bacterium]|nr:type I-E CRISPR-associated protein Cse2/CasB [Fimbriimonadaceae bacterium]
MSEDMFISYLNAFPQIAKYATGQVAAYRRACGHRLAESKGCQDFCCVSTKPSDFLTVTLAAQYASDKIKSRGHHQTYKNQGSIGAAWAEYCRKRKQEDDPYTFYKRRQDSLAAGNSPANVPSIHERFRKLLDAELELDGTGELAYRLRGMVRMLVAEDIPIDVIQLAHDLRGWRAESRYVQERWAKAFYAPPFEKKIDDATTDEDDNETNELEDEEEENAD